MTRRRMRTLSPGFGIALLLLLVMAVAGTSGRLREREKRKALPERNLTILDGSGPAWVLEIRPAVSDLIHQIGEDPVCSSGLPGHRLWEMSMSEPVIKEP